MWLLIIGVILLAAAMAGLEPVAGWPWWAIGSPFALAAAWWVMADALGLTKVAAQRRAERRIDERQDRMRAALGLGVKTSSRVRREQEVRNAQARQQRIRLESDKRGKDAVLRSSFTAGDSVQFADTVGALPRTATGNGD